MELNKLVFGGLMAGCLAAASGGGYLAVRHNAVDATQTAPPAAQTVTESEGLLTPAEAATGSAATPATPTPDRAPAPAARPTRAPEPAPAAPARSTRTERVARTTRPDPAPAPAPAAPSASRTASARRPLPPEPAPPMAPPAAPSMWETRPSVQPSTPDFDPEPPPPPAKEFMDLTVPSDSVIGMQLESTITSERASVEDKVEARVTRDVRVGGRVAIPAGSLVEGSVMEVDRGGKMRGKSRLAIRFHTVTLADGTRLNLKTDSIVREGASPAGESAAKVGGAAVGGAILGAILGGGKGAAIGAGIGAGGGTAAVMASDRNPVTIPAGTTVTVRVQQPVTVTVEKGREN